MKLVIGGACQGKKAYASRTYKIREEEWKDGSLCSENDIYTAGAVEHFHEFIKNRMEEGRDIGQLTKEIIKKNPDVVLVTNEVGYGIVPVDKKERIWRETCGRACTRLAEFSDEVVRVCCGIGMKIK